MSVGHKDPALATAREVLRDICECGEFDDDHTGRRATIYTPPDGPCGVQGCTCQRLRRARLVAMRPGRKVGQGEE